MQLKTITKKKGRESSLEEKNENSYISRHNYSNKIIVGQLLWLYKFKSATMIYTSTAVSCFKG